MNETANVIHHVYDNGACGDPECCGSFEEWTSCGADIYAGNTTYDWAEVTCPECLANRAER
jgi:hypothetical protein